MKKYPFKQARFIQSVIDCDALPLLTDINGRVLDEIAIVGRSNVGKSSLINHVLGMKKLAKVSNTPGKTQLLNFFVVDQALALVDLPGYGYAACPKTVIKKWSETINHYLRYRTSLKLILFLLDMRRVPTEEDIAFLNWTIYYKKPVMLILTKADKLKKQERHAQISAILKTLKEVFPRMEFPFLSFSIKDTKSKQIMIDQLNAFLKEYHGASL